MRQVHKTDAYTYWSVGFGASRYAKDEAASLCAELHILGYKNNEVRVLKSEDISGVFNTSVTRTVFAVFTDAPDDIVEQAKTKHTFTENWENNTKESVLLQARVWGLTHYYSRNWVPAYRLLCAALHPEDAKLRKTALDNYDETDKRAFVYELDRTEEDMQKLYGPFYFGGKWTVVRK